MTKTLKFQLPVFALILLLLGSCEKEYTRSAPAKTPPKTSQPTTTLEASLVTTAPSALNSPYWKTANYLVVSAKDISKGILYGDGGLNLTGTFGGLTSFNKGNDPKITLKAAYDAEYVYILAEWSDTTVNPSEHSLFINAGSDPLKPTENPTGWTSQKNSDKLSFAFDIDGAAGSSGTFASVGCQASCHGTGNSTVMTPNSGSVDIWNWSLATSNPLGYAHDLVTSGSGFINDAGGNIAQRNSANTGERATPKYEWNGVEQSVTLPNGGSGLLDPTYFLLNKNVMPGDAMNGETIYNAVCEHCHGPNGSGGEYSAINGVGSNKKSRAAYMAAMDNVGDMGGYWGPLSASEKDDVVSFLRGIAGAPGYYLTAPTANTSAADITIVSNVKPTDISNSMSNTTNKHGKYQVLIKRKLKTNNTDDVQFNLGTKKEYVFGIALMDNDGKNHIGSAKETLTFK
ncbi:MAG: hypothetical protein CFE21_01780 [Bacteroidetes bacterium B1(2017)]|nr:MAG: hypothetical protein CFE21_01780 [Bacteroidetes bacterium B1(2017)]